MRALLLGLVLVATGCATTGTISLAVHQQQTLDAAKGLTLLQQAKFDEADAEAARVLAADPKNATAHGVAAIAEYQKTLHNLVTDLIGFFGSVVASVGLHGSFIDTRFAEFALTEADKGLGGVDTHLAAAAMDPFFTLDLCLACWEVDWNRDGRIDRRDQQLFEIENDGEGQEYPEGDPRRRPTFRFDAADVQWLKALIGFQRAAGRIVRAYDLKDLGGLMERGRQVITLPIKDATQIATARKLIEEGLESAKLCRALVLAETDDEREWVPNPNQKSHPMPLPVDAALFDTWAGVLDDVRALIDGKQGISVAQLAQLGKHRWEGEQAPGGFLDIGQMFDKPGDIVLDEAHLKHVKTHDKQSVETAFHDVFGAAYKPSMEPSPLIKRLTLMKAELDKGNDTFERKLRYLLWLN